jgi:hypothetical protein
MDRSEALAKLAEPESQKTVEMVRKKLGTKAGLSE